MANISKVSDGVTLLEAAEICGYSVDYLRTVRARTKSGKMAIPFPAIIGRDVDRPGRPLVFSRTAVQEWAQTWGKRQAERNGRPE